VTVTRREGDRLRRKKTRNGAKATEDPQDDGTGLLARWTACTSSTLRQLRLRRRAEPDVPAPAERPQRPLVAAPRNRHRLARLPSTSTRRCPMKVRIHVSLKPGVLDPQGRAVHHALEGLGFAGIADVRVGRLIEIDVADGTSDADLEAMCRQLLANLVIENYRIEKLEAA
jgi:phosphoribosylformylglycinamidine synthase PurS subunit